MGIIGNARFGAIALAAAASLGATGAQGAAIAGLFNTGVDANGVALPGGNGLTDWHYKILASDAAVIWGSPVKTYYNAAYAPDDGDSRWVSFDGDGDATGGLGSLTTYRQTFTLAGLDHLTAVITGRFAADNGARLVLNGVDTAFWNDGYAVFTSFTLNSGFVAGVNTLDFRVYDNRSPTAFRVDDLVGTADLAPGGFPEPSTWAMLILGFGLTGSAARLRRRLAV